MHIGIVDSDSDEAEAQTIHRADLHNVLIQNTPAHFGKHFSKRLVSFTSANSGEVILNFEDGSTAVCDLLVGADGVRSPVRQQLYQYLASNAENEGKPQVEVDLLRRKGLAYWTGNTVYRSLIPREDLVKINPEHPSLFTATQVRTVGMRVDLVDCCLSLNSFSISARTRRGTLFIFCESVLIYLRISSC